MYDQLLFLHLVAAAFWLGGLMFLPLLIFGSVRLLPRDSYRPLIGRVAWYFAWGAVAAWVLLVISGLVMAHDHLHSLSALQTTAFGRILRAKIGWIAVTLLASLGHIVTGRSQSPALTRVSRGLGGLAFIATLVVFYYATLL